MTRFLKVVAIGLLAAVIAVTTAPSAVAQHNGGGGGGGSVDPTNAGTVIKLSNFNRNYNGASAKGQVTLGYAADGSAQSITFNLSQINLPDGAQLQIEVETGIYRTIVSYYTYQILQYTVTPGTLTVKGKSVSLTLSKLKGDVIPDFPLPAVGTTEVRIYSPDHATEILDGNAGKLRP